MPQISRRLALAALFVLPLCNPAPAAEPNMLVFAAASLKDALDAAIAAYTQQTGEKISVSYAASSTLAKQIENGAPAALFISADQQWMDYLEVRRLIRPETRVALLGNRLVLIAPADSKASIELKRGAPLARLLGDGRLAMADPDSVPAGLYGKAALQSLGIWATVADRVVRAENVRSALYFVARGEAPLGIVYATDAAADSSVRVIATFPGSSHPPIVYPAAVTVASRGAAPASLLAFLSSAPARPFFERQGFAVLEPGP